MQIYLLIKKKIFNCHDSLLLSSITTLFFFLKPNYIYTNQWLIFLLSLIISFQSLSLPSLFCSALSPSNPKPMVEHHHQATMAGPLSQAIATHHLHRLNLRLLSVGGSIVGLSSPALSSSSWVSQVRLVQLWFMGCDSLSDGFWSWVLVMF